MGRGKKGDKNNYCTYCKTTGHLQKDCNKDPKNKGNYCTYCKTTGHLQKDCSKDPKNKDKHPKNNQKNQCGYCGNNGHYEAYCDRKKQDAANTGAHSGYLMTAPWQISPPQPEALWCKWCNSLYHSTASCQDTNSKLEVIVMAESNSSRCDRCGYKGHVSTNCRNPHPEVKCIFCQERGHAFQDCVRRTEPRIHEILASLSSDPSGSTVKKDVPSHAMSNTITTFKRRREALDQSQRACNDFIANLVNATSNKETQDVIPVRDIELLSTMDVVLNCNSGADCNLWGKDLTETFKAMRMYHLAEGVSFFRIAYAIHRLEAGFNISCAHPGCKGNAAIITPEFQPVNVSTRSGYPRDQHEHAVFLATDCSHSFFAFEWRRSRIEAGDLKPLYLLQAAHSDPILNQYTELKAGITTRDLDLEYDAMLETEKRRQALDAEQQKIVETSRRLELQEMEFRKYADRLGSPMDYKMTTPVTSTHNNPPLSTGFGSSGGPSNPKASSDATGFSLPNHKKRRFGDSEMVDVSSPRDEVGPPPRDESGAQNAPKRSKPESSGPEFTGKGHEETPSGPGTERAERGDTGSRGGRGGARGGRGGRGRGGARGGRGGRGGGRGGREGYSPRGGHTGGSSGAPDGPSDGSPGKDNDDGHIL
ncbi:hypothetical protein KCU65_g9332, partial [Aureobasidium melanogenum]